MDNTRRFFKKAASIEQFEKKKLPDRSIIWFYQINFPGTQQS
jgi:hypothetical protein